MTNKNGALRSGLWVKRTTAHACGEENGHLTMGRSYQVMSADLHYSRSRNFLNRAGNPSRDTDVRLADDCVVLRDDRGKYGVFGIKNFKLTSGAKK